MTRIYADEKAVEFTAKNAKNPSVTSCKIQAPNTLFHRSCRQDRHRDGPTKPRGPPGRRALPWEVQLYCHRHGRDSGPSLSPDRLWDANRDGWT